MGHWAPTTLGNDHAWDILGDVARRSRTRAIERFVSDGLALPDPPGPVDELAAPRMLALAEAVAAGLGRPSPDLLPEHAAWCAAQGDLLAESVDAARAVIEPVLGGPYPLGWHGPDGCARFAASVADLQERLAAGRTTSLASVEDRFRRALSPSLEARGFALDSPTTWTRQADGGVETIHVRLRTRDGRTSALVWLSRDFSVEQARLHAILGLPPPTEPVPALIVRPPRALWDRLGDRGWIPLSHPDDPPGDHRESSVRVAAEKSVAWVTRVGEASLARLCGPALGDYIRARSFEHFRRTSASKALLTWILVAGRVAPETVERLAEERRAHLRRISSDELRATLINQLDCVVSSLRT